LPRSILASAGVLALVFSSGAAWAQSAPAASPPVTVPTGTDASAGGSSVPSATTEAAQGEPGTARWYVQTSVHTRHFRPSPEHHNTQQLINVERIRADGWLAGAAVFHNSFGQPSQMLYLGRRWHPLERFPEMHVKLVAGVLHGYKGEYRDKIPFNRSGVAPVVLPAIGWTYKRFASELIVFGNSGLLFTLGYHLN
jgi:hypothetical protein